MSTTYKVSGMSCGGCSSSLTKALGAAGVDATVSHEQGTVTVEGAHDAATVERVVEDAGFDFDGAA